MKTKKAQKSAPNAKLISRLSALVEKAEELVKSAKPEKKTAPKKRAAKKATPAKKKAAKKARPAKKVAKR